jgi:hypothetical protein
MKNLFTTLLVCLFIHVNAGATTYTSVGNGNWKNPLTWSPIGVPFPTDNVIINHNVMLDTSLLVLGQITVNANASLIGNNPTRDIWMNAANASITNHGDISIRYMLLSAGVLSNTGTFIVKSFHNSVAVNNSGTMQGVDSLYNNTPGVITNNGTLRTKTFFNQSTIRNYGEIKGFTLAVDSLYNNATFTNYAGSNLTANRVTNNGTFVNESEAYFNYFLNFINGNFTNNDTMSFDWMTNMGQFTNSGEIEGVFSLWNVENFTNHGSIHLGLSLLNADTIAGTATLVNHGSMVIDDSFYNYNTVNGYASGSFIVQDSSYNSGTMQGAYDFCDMTPVPTFPKVDYNFGWVDFNISFCGVLSIDESTDTKIELYPNPSSGMVYFGGQTVEIKVLSTDGKVIRRAKTDSLDTSSMQTGVYFIQFLNNSGDLIQTEKLIKE